MSEYTSRKLKKEQHTYTTTTTTTIRYTNSYILIGFGLIWNFLFEQRVHTR